MAASNATTRCVVLASSQPDDALASALAERLWHSLPATDPLEAFAELCLLERRTHVDRPWGGEPRGDVALVIVEPRTAGQPDIDAMLASIDRYLPRVAVWSFAAGALRRLDERGPEGSAENGAAAAGPDDGDPAPSEITREEIAMLLDMPDADDEP